MVTGDVFLQAGLEEFSLAGCDPQVLSKLVDFSCGQGQIGFH